MFKVFLSKIVWDGENIEASSNWAQLRWELDLPFVPFVGLDIQLPMQRSWRLRTVSWDANTQFFACNLEDQFINIFDESEFDEWVECLVEGGWILVGKYQNDFSAMQKLQLADHEKR